MALEYLTAKSSRGSENVKAEQKNLWLFLTEPYYSISVDSGLSFKENQNLFIFLEENGLRFLLDLGFLGRQNGYLRMMDVDALSNFSATPTKSKRLEP